MRKIWQEDILEGLSSFRNLKSNYQDIIPEVLQFVESNQQILEEWRLDKWVDDRNLGRVQLWDGDWRVIPFPIDCVGSTATEEDFELSEMVTFTKLFNTTTERCREVLPLIKQSFIKNCPKTFKYLEEDIEKQLLKSATISRLSPGTKINPHNGDIDSLRLHFLLLQILAHGSQSVAENGHGKLVTFSHFTTMTSTGRNIMVPMTASLLFSIIVLNNYKEMV